MLKDGNEIVQVTIATVDREKYDRLAERLGVRRSALFTRILTYVADNQQVVKEAFIAHQREQFGKLEEIGTEPEAPAAPPSKPKKHKAAAKPKR